MPRLTKEQQLGTKFEIFVEQLFKSLGVRKVRRNVVYHRDRYLYRQVDVEFYNQDLVIVELKYSSNGKIGYKLRGGEKNKSGQLISTINNLIDEVEERRLFVRANKAVLITNQDFSAELYQKVRDYRAIEMYNGNDLIRISQNQDIENQIKRVDLRKYPLKPTKIHI